MSREPAAAPESDRFEDAPHPRETLAFFGHAAAEQALLTAYRQDRMAQAWILGGPRGRRQGDSGLAARALPAGPSRPGGAGGSAGRVPVRARRGAGGAAGRRDGARGRVSSAAKLEREDQEILHRDPHRRCARDHPRLSSGIGNRRLARRHRRLRRRPQPLQRQRAAQTDRGAARARAVLADRASAGTPAADHPLAVSQADAGAAGAARHSASRAGAGRVFTRRLRPM